MSLTFLFIIIRRIALKLFSPCHKRLWKKISKYFAVIAQAHQLRLNSLLTRKKCQEGLEMTPAGWFGFFSGSFWVQLQYFAVPHVVSDCVKVARKSRGEMWPMWPIIVSSLESLSSSARVLIKWFLSSINSSLSITELFAEATKIIRGESQAIIYCFGYWQQILGSWLLTNREYIKGIS